MIYADYRYYQQEWRGNLPEKDWYPAAREASAYVDLITFGRLKGHPEWVTEDVQNAVCAAVDVIAHYDSAVSQRTPGVSSESVGSQSISYEGAASVQESRAQALRSAVDCYLLPGDPLRYAGVCECW